MCILKIHIRVKNLILVWRNNKRLLLKLLLIIIDKKKSTAYITREVEVSQSSVAHILKKPSYKK